MIPLTDYETGELVLVAPGAIRMVRQLVCEVFDDVDEIEPIEMGRRTLVVVDRSRIYVKEDAALILGMIMSGGSVSTPTPTPKN